MKTFFYYENQDYYNRTADSDYNRGNINKNRNNNKRKNKIFEILDIKDKDININDELFYAKILKIIGEKYNFL